MRIQPALELNPAQRNDPAKIDKVARQLEGQFAQMLIKSMREASFGDSLFPGENQMFREMYDQKIAAAMTQGKGLGLSAVIARQLAGQQGDGPALDPQIAPAKASRAYQLNAPAERPPLPLDAADDPVRMLQQMAAGPHAGAAAPAEQALDLIAGRETSALHRSLGATDPYAALPAAAEDWSTGSDQWMATASNRGTAVSARDALASNAAVAELGAHTPEGFVASIWQHAKAAAQELGVDARALVAQAALETGWGKRQIKHGDGRSAHNLFGIKAIGWNGDSAMAGTHEYVGGVRQNETARFRAYGSPAESFADYVRLLKTSPRYQQALQAGTDVHGFARGLQRAGYATDPGYAGKIASIAQGPVIDRAVAAIGDAGARLGQTFASTASAVLANQRR
ncbi:flagellar assembly peptidoglycan hydrolase FlgJ [Stenotrophomonas sp. 24(2023)]|uniref:flagellar assembly peptidoglycan hydrolase FlgJ n=1 Tax=Stenotrophomonas sp. 24(2023) TaxID=3068324 RepID=UPI0027DF2314|nr:flagellar assembly peptidoglycan hydrolase FlgJ [Stenotrophomonas sp. 24(2023)]WMJ69129.1 flagellar assembly peptidoglycan hydrolase FlgJ [Stenotrophomonas sp. 24(2023)]